MIIDKIKKINLAGMSVSLLTAIAARSYWEVICRNEKDCTYQLVTGILEPLEFGGYALALFFLSFLFLPSHYFQAWLKKIFFWAFPLSVVLVLATQDTPGFSFSFPRTLVVQMLGIFFGIVSLLFIIVHYLKNKKTNS